MGVISETLKVNEVNTQKKFFEFEKTKERRQGEAFKKGKKKKKVIVKDFQLSGELTAASRWLLPGHLNNASSWSKSCRLSCWGFAATPLSSDTAEGRSLQTQTLLCFFFFFLFYCLMLQSCDTTGRRTESEKYNQRGPGRLICCRLTSHLIALKYPHAYSREEEKKKKTANTKKTKIHHPVSV